MHAWLETASAKLSRKSDTAAAIRYALSRWRALTRYVDDGSLDIENNAAERTLRVVALGAKTSFSQDPMLAENGVAAMYCLLGSAKLNRLDPEIYLQHVLERIADHPISRIDDLLPWNVPLTTPGSPLIVKSPHKIRGLLTSPHTALISPRNQRSGADHTLTELVLKIDLNAWPHGSAAWVRHSREL